MFNWRELLTFRCMVTPYILQGLFVLLSVIVISSGLILLFSGRPNSIVSGLSSIFIGPIIIRVVLESFVVVFRIYDTLLDIKQNLQRK